MPRACAVTFTVACLAVPHFSKLSHRKDGLKKVTVYKECVFASPQILSEIFTIFFKSERNKFINVYCFHVKCSLFFSDFKET